MRDHHRWIGRSRPAAAKLLASRGARIAVSGPNEDRLAPAVAQLKSAPTRTLVLAHAVAVTDGAGLERLIANVAST